MKALIVVDMQNDFIYGSLAVPGARDEDFLVAVNREIDAFHNDNGAVFYTRDYHAPNHPSFVEQGGRWPPHCVIGTFGAEFHYRLFMAGWPQIIAKGMHKEAYSGFDGTGLAALLHCLKIDDVTIVGLATEYCVRATALDSAVGFATTIVCGAIRAVDSLAGDQALHDMYAAGVKLR